MSVAEKLGLLPGFGWVAGHDFLPTLGICLLITRVGHCLVGLILESRWVPLSPSKQFLSFFPGDVFLGLMTAGLLMQAWHLSSEEHWYNSTKWHVLVLVCALIVACFMTWQEYREGVYPSRAMWSPTKLYHNFVLYGGYGYVIVTTLIAVVASARSWVLLLVLLPGFVWLSFLFIEGQSSDEVKDSRVRHAHIDDWRFFWQSS